MLVTRFGIMSWVPPVSVSVPERPFASASMYHMVASPQTASAIDCSVSPSRTV